MSNGRKQFVAKDHIKDFNTFVQNVSFPLSETQLKEGLKGCKVPFGIGFIDQLIKFGFVAKTRDGYIFVKRSAPINFIDLQKVYQEYHKKACTYYHTHKNSSGLKRNKENILKAVRFLESFGCTVFINAAKLEEL